ncbi:MAG: UbiD family decarboxylase [Desulfobacteraceae bacterium]|jgi:4-hydroxy-3-polyprenylbenzoate decarboxylase|nr:MAG: UbiD family decarboxylase [Desulfobacteraceae bacterium]
MAFNDLRAFLKKLRDLGQFVELKKELESGYEVSALGWELSDRGGGPAILFRIKGYETPVVANVQGTLQRNAIALGLEPADTMEKNFVLIRNRVAQVLAAKETWLEPKLVSTGPCQEVVLTGEKVNLKKLPVLKWNPMDGGPYITLPNVITKDPVNPRFGRNNGMYRVMIHDEKSTGIMTVATQDIGIHIARARKAGMKTMPVAIAVGLDPVINMVSCTKMGSFMDDEFGFAGGLRGEPVEMVKCKTIDLDVPAHAELILEGELDLQADSCKWEGSFGEWMGYYEEPMLCPLFRVKAITHRKDWIYQMCTLGHERSDGDLWKIPMLQANNYNFLKTAVIGFRDYYAPISSRGYKAVVQIDKRYPGWGKQAVLAYLGSGQGFAAANYVVVVDEDIDIYNQEMVDWAIATRMDPARDIIIIPEVGVYPLNPAASRRVESNETGFTEFGFIGKMGIDATKKIALENRRPTGVPVRPNHEALEKVRKDWPLYGLEGNGL